MSFKKLIPYLFSFFTFQIYAQSGIMLGTAYVNEANGKGELYYGYGLTQPPNAFLSYEAGYFYQLKNWFIGSNILYKEFSNPVGYTYLHYSGSAFDSYSKYDTHKMDLFFNYGGIDLRINCAIDLGKKHTIRFGLIGSFERLLTFKESNFVNSSYSYQHHSAPQPYEWDTTIYYPTTYEKFDLFLARQNYYKLNVNVSYAFSLGNFFIEAGLTGSASPYKRLKYIDSSLDAFDRRRFGMQAKLGIGYFLPSKRNKKREN